MRRTSVLHTLIVLSGVYTLVVGNVNLTSSDLSRATDFHARRPDTHLSLPRLFDRPCCDLPTRETNLEDLVACLKDTKLMCADRRRDELQRRKFCFRGAEKSGTSVSLRIIHSLADWIPYLYPDYTILKQPMREANGFEFELSHDTKVGMIGLRGHANKPKHTAHADSDCEIIMSMRDIRDEVVSMYFYHHHDVPSGTKVEKGWCANDDGKSSLRSRFCPVLVSQFVSLPATLISRRFSEYQGMLTSRFDAMKYDKPSLMLQLLDFWGFRRPTDDPGFDKRLDNVLTRINRHFTISKTNTTQLDAKELDDIHFHGGAVEGFKTKMFPEDVEYVNRRVCDEAPLHVAMWGMSETVENCPLKPHMADMPPCARKSSWGCPFPTNTSDFFVRHCQQEDKYVTITKDRLNRMLHNTPSRAV